MKIRVSIIGASGYTGVELIRLLLKHPKVQISYFISKSNDGNEIAKIFPHLTQIINNKFEDVDLEIIAENSDIVFLALPHGNSIEVIPKLLEKHCRVIDLSADMRIKNVDTYKKWYQADYVNEELLCDAVYGLPEIYPYEVINSASVIANPGCYPTATILALAPLIKHNLINISHQPLIIDAKSGISGAGKTLNQNNHFCEAINNFSAYQIGGIHRHIPEIEQELSKLAMQTVQIQFTPHLIPTPRGMLVTIYCSLNSDIHLNKIKELYYEYYVNKPFIRIMPTTDRASIKSVIGSNFCDIYLYHDLRTNYLTIISCIDNLIKGAAGQAIQNMNILSGLNETTGLQNIPTYI
ncbi:MAG: N-acetyl-gamma-glutamyl-phosphate reductase [Burkholderiales bacterium]|nr:N-acetyl-gamma-glutamyl-phosphate reductase [Burkholderiales bacterium]